MVGDRSVVHGGEVRNIRYAPLRGDDAEVRVTLNNLT